MNARNRLAKAVLGNNPPGTLVNEWLAADRMLAVLPDLLTDPDVIRAASRSLGIGGGWASASERMEHALTAAAQALTGGDT